MIAALKISSKVEDIYRQAAISYKSNKQSVDEIEKNFRSIANDRQYKLTGPVERAEIIRILAFRQLPIDLFSPCLIGVERLHIITDVEIRSVTTFVADFFSIFNISSTNQGDIILNLLYEAVKNSQVPPQDFFQAFESSRRLLLQKNLSPDIFLAKLIETLSLGVPPDQMYESIGSSLKDAE